MTYDSDGVPPGVSARPTRKSRRYDFVPVDQIGAMDRFDFSFSHETPLWAYVATYGRGRQWPRFFRGDVHEGLELAVVLAGGEERLLADQAEPVLVETGQVWSASMWEPHAGRLARADTEVVVIIFLPEFLGDELVGGIPWLQLFALPPSQRPRLTDDKMRQAARDIGLQLKRELEERGSAWQTAVKGGLLQLLALLHRAWEAESAPVYNRSALVRILPVVARLRSDPTQRLSLSEAGEMCGLSPAHFSVVFTRTMGTGFREFTLNNRLDCAAHLLLSVSLPVEEIASRLSFTDASHLHRYFVKRYGCTPGEYRRRFAE